jgi:DNA-binding response OmpR family regulator
MNRCKIAAKDTYRRRRSGATVDCMSTTVFLADRESVNRGLLQQRLSEDGFELVAAAEPRPDLVLGDEAALDRWRGEAPVIVIGKPEADPVDRVRAFRRGCDDYLPRPFHYDELVARIHAVLRRTQRPAEMLVAGPLEIDARTRAAAFAGKPLSLSQKEYDLLLRLAADPERVFTKEELLRDVWDYRSNVRTRTLDSHVSRLRRKLRALDPEAALLENVWGVGYRLVGITSGFPQAAERNGGFPLS